MPYARKRAERRHRTQMRASGRHFPSAGAVLLLAGTAAVAGCLWWPVRENPERGLVQGDALSCTRDGADIEMARGLGAPEDGEIFDRYTSCARASDPRTEFAIRELCTCRAVCAGVDEPSRAITSCHGQPCAFWRPGCADVDRRRTPAAQIFNDLPLARAPR
jgi:hypothetical protein